MQAMRGVWGSSSPSPAAPSTAASSQPPPGTAPGSTGETTRKLSPLPPSAFGPNIPAISGASPASTSSSEPSVFVSGADKVYHKAGCDLLDKKKHAMALSEARSKGYAACSRCYASTVLKAP